MNKTFLGIGAALGVALAALPALAQDLTLWSWRQEDRAQYEQFIDTFGAKDRAQFSKVVLVQFPRPGAYTIGFVTNINRGEAHAHLPAEHWAVFVPTSPSPVNGFFMFLPAAEIIELDMSVGEGMKTVISCGAVLPQWTDPAAAKAALRSESAKGK